ncbi:DUF2064 domain-containing protein [Wenyingzhuangia sp. IMCC45533]
MNSKVAILIFAQNGTQELKQIPEAALLFNTLNKEIISKVQATRCDYFVCNENNQVGNSFGERLTHAVQQIFNAGYLHVIAVGNDTPQLTTNALKVAVSNCAKGLSTFGPSNDGGFYLMTFKRISFQPEKLNTLPWQTSTLIKKVLQQLSETDYVLLKHLNDIDCYDDLIYLNKYQYQNISTSLKEVLSSVLPKSKIIYDLVESIYWNLSSSNIFNKGSPLVSISAN